MRPVGVVPGRRFCDVFKGMIGSFCGGGRSRSG